MGIYIGQTKYTGGPADPSSSMIPKSIGTSAGDLIYFTGSSVPVRLPKGSAGQVLTMNSGATAPIWATPSGGGGGGTTVTLPSGYNASTGITLNSSTLTTVCNIGGVDLNLKAPAGGGSSNQDFYYTTATYDANFGHRGYSVYHVTTDPTKRNFVVVNLTSAQYPQDEVPQIIFNYDSNTQQLDTSLLPGAEIYMLIVNGTGDEIPQQASAYIDQEALFDTGVSGYWVNDPPVQLSNQSQIGFWKKIPAGASLFCSTILKNTYGNPEFCVNTWLGTFYEI